MPIASLNDWRDKYLLSDGKNPRPLSCFENCVIALSSAPEWRDVLAWNEFTHLIQIDRKTPWGKSSRESWDDSDDRLALRWLQRENLIVPLNLCHDAVLTVAHMRKVNPLLDFLNDLTWDGWHRIDDWLTYYMGVEETDYSRAIGRAWLISAVARAYQPGCKADHCLILEGVQGLKKSTALKILAGPDLFTDSMPSDLASKEAQIACAGIWIVEFGELEGLVSSEKKIETVKRFMSCSEDRFRPPYGRHSITVPRQCVFAGSTNKEHYMIDSTGNRRFWPVKCTEINVEGLKRDRAQLWAEAVTAYRDNSEDWWLTEELETLARREQERRMELDPWQDTVSFWLKGRTDTSVDELLSDCIGKKLDARTRADQMQAARCLKKAGWSKYRISGKGATRWSPD
jgi:predicted P-loop ATPase